jgi:ATP-binding cassette subfamily F protein 3
VVELEGGQLTEYAGNYSYFRDKKAAMEKAAAQAASQALAAEKKQASKQDRTTMGQASSAKGANNWRKPDTTRLVKKLEEEIAFLEQEISALEAKLNDPASHEDAVLSRELADAYAARQAELDEKYGSWMELTGE